MTDDIGSSERLEDAPAPDDPRKPQTPPKLHKPSWMYALRRAMREFVFDQCIDSAGALTYFGVLAIFPGLLAAFSILGVLGEGSNATSTVLSLVQQIVPGSTAAVIKGPLEEFARSPAAGVALVGGIVLAIWTASGYVGAFARAMNRIYEIDEGRPYWKKKPAQLLVTLILIVLVVVMLLTLVISGPVADAVGNALGMGPAIKTTWSILKWPILAAAVIVAIAILYHATPNVRQPKFRWTTVGGAFAFILIVIASVGFGAYVANFSHYNKSYGSLAGIIIFLIWLWIANNLLLLGAEFDSEIERGRELQAGIKAEEAIKLPPRDAVQSERNAEKEEKEVDAGRSLRESRGHGRNRGKSG